MTITLTKHLAAKQPDGRWLLLRGKYAGAHLDAVPGAYLAWAIDTGAVPEAALDDSLLDDLYLEACEEREERGYEDIYEAPYF